jgi:hypothetical protein
MIDPHAARILRAAAARHIEQATQLEAFRMKLGASRPRFPNGSTSWSTSWRAKPVKGQNPRTDAPCCVNHWIMGNWLPAFVSLHRLNSFDIMTPRQ